MPKVEVRDAARQDIKDIFARIAADNRAAALRVHDAIVAEFDLLARHPGAGPSCDFPEPDLADLRFSPVKRYRAYLVIYRPLVDGVEVVRVIHAATDLGRAFRGM
jgi:toxin ParE1/3/4